MIYKEKSKLCLSFFGITISSGLIPLFRYRDNGIINNLPEPDPTERACRCADEKIRESVLEKLREQQKQEPTARQERPGIFCRPEERSLE